MQMSQESSDPDLNLQLLNDMGFTQSKKLMSCLVLSNLSTLLFS